jgi:hypothetical protein
MEDNLSPTNPEWTREYILSITPGRITIPFSAFLDRPVVKNRSRWLVAVLLIPLVVWASDVCDIRTQQGLRSLAARRTDGLCVSLSVML